MDDFCFTVGPTQDTLNSYLVRLMLLALYVPDKRPCFLFRHLRKGPGDAATGEEGG